MPLLQLTSSPTQSQGYISPRKRTVNVKKKIKSKNLFILLLNNWNIHVVPDKDKI